MHGPLFSASVLVHETASDAVLVHDSAHRSVSEACVLPIDVNVQTISCLEAHITLVTLELKVVHDTASDAVLVHDTARRSVSEAC